MRNLEARNLKTELAKRMQEVAEFLLPCGHLSDDQMQWLCGDRHGTSGNSLKLELHGDKAGLWHDFATDEGGDILALWMQTRDVSFPTVCKEAAQFLEDPSSLEPRTPSNSEKKTRSKSDGAKKPKVKMKAQPTHIWHYRNSAGEVIGNVVRWDAEGGGYKEVKPYFKPNGNGGFLPGYPDELKDNRPLYGDRPDKNGTIVVTEGEKAADAVRQMGFSACTSPGGCNSAKNADWTLLKDAKQVLIWADNDEPGMRYANDVARLVHAVSPKADIHILTYGKEGQDAADFVYDRLEELGRIWDEYEKAPEIKELAGPFRALAHTASTWSPPVPPKNRPKKHRTRKGSLLVESFDKVEAEKVNWIWEGKIAEGKLNLLTGEPDTGKTNLGCYIISTVTTGSCWPFSQNAPAPGHVLVLSSEDGTADTLIPRLMAYGADLSRVHRIKALTEGTGMGEKDSVEVGKLTTTNLIKSLRESILPHENVRLIFIDPLSAYLDVRNAHSEAEIRSALEPLADFAEEYGIAILAIAHVNKSSTDNPMDKISGSKGVVAQARTCYMAINASPELGETDNYLVKVKSNISGPEASQGLTYRIESTTVRNAAGEEIETSQVRWTGTCTYTASQILKKRRKDMGHKQLMAAERWLEEFLEDSPRLAADVRKAGAAEGMSDRTLDRARNDLGFTSHRIGFGGNTVWFNKRQHERFQELLDQGIPSDEALSRLEPASGLVLIEVDTPRLQDESIPAIP